MLTDLLNGKIDVLIGHRDVEGVALESITADFRSLSPDLFSIHVMGPVYVAHERAFSSPGNLERIFAGIAKGWDAAYSDYGRTIPLIDGSIDAKSSPALIFNSWTCSDVTCGPFRSHSRRQLRHPDRNLPQSVEYADGALSHV